MKSEITIEYVKCRAGTMGVRLPIACSWSVSSFWKNCDKAIHDENPSLWTTYDNFHNGIGTMCFANTFQKQQEMIRQEMIRLHETGRNITDGVLGIVNEIMTLRKNHAAYFESIDKSIRNTTAVVVSVAADVSKIQSITRQVIDAVDIVSNDMKDISSDTSFIRSGVGRAAVELGTMLGVMKELKDAFEIIEKSRPFLTFVNDTFTMIWHLWGVLSSLWRSYFNAFQSSGYGYPIAISLLFLILWIWWYHFHGFLIKSSPLIIFSMLDHLQLDWLRHITPLLIAVICTIITLLSFVLYRLLSIIYMRRRRDVVNKRLEETYLKLMGSQY